MQFSLRQLPSDEATLIVQIIQIVYHRLQLHARGKGTNFRVLSLGHGSR